MLVSITKDTLTPELQRLLAAAKRPRTIWEAGGKSLQVEISAHLRRLQARGNAKGWPSQKFFAGKATSVEKHVGQPATTDKAAVVTISDPRFVHRITGGTVTPKRGKYLAIPLTAEAYAKAGKGSIRSSMPGLFVVKFPRGLYLVREEATTVPGKGKTTSLRLLPLFKLVSKVTHRPHPEELPDVNKLALTVQAQMVRAAEILFKAGK